MFWLEKDGVVIGFENPFTADGFRDSGWRDTAAPVPEKPKRKTKKDE